MDKNYFRTSEVHQGFVHPGTDRWRPSWIPHRLGSAISRVQLSDNGVSIALLIIISTWRCPFADKSPNRGANSVAVRLDSRAVLYSGILWHAVRTVPISHRPLAKAAGAFDWCTWLITWIVRHPTTFVHGSTAIEMSTLAQTKPKTKKKLLLK